MPSEKHLNRDLPPDGLIDSPVHDSHAASSHDIDQLVATNLSNRKVVHGTALSFASGLMRRNGYTQWVH
jgi:hypothetical protein